MSSCFRILLIAVRRAAGVAPSDPIVPGPGLLLIDSALGGSKVAFGDGGAGDGGAGDLDRRPSTFTPSPSPSSSRPNLSLPRSVPTDARSDGGILGAGLDDDAGGGGDAPLGTPLGTPIGTPLGTPLGTPSPGDVSPRPATNPRASSSSPLGERVRAEERDEPDSTSSSRRPPRRRRPL